MFAFYVKILGLNLALSNLVLLLASVARAVPFSTDDFLLVNAILFLTVSLIFLSLDLLGLRSSALQLSDKD
jgi:hypothetical protein